MGWERRNMHVPVYVHNNKYFLMNFNGRAFNLINRPIGLMGSLYRRTARRLALPVLFLTCISITAHVIDIVIAVLLVFTYAGDFSFFFIPQGRYTIYCTWPIRSANCQKISPWSVQGCGFETWKFGILPIQLPIKRGGSRAWFLYTKFAWFMRLLIRINNSAKFQFGC